jgi:uncharacterized protein YajQ (UPF0234 family)
MPSFDIVSQVSSMEIENAVNIARKELANRGGCVQDQSLVGDSSWQTCPAQYQFEKC